MRRQAAIFNDKWNLPGSKKKRALRDAGFTFDAKCGRLAIRRVHKKDPLAGVPKSDHRTGSQTGLNFFNDNSAFFTDLDAAFAAQTFFGIDGYGFAVLHFKDFNRANIHAFFAASAFFFVDDRIKSHYIRLLSN
jgi:hypothetical protein